LLTYDWTKNGGQVTRLPRSFDSAMPAWYSQLQMPPADNQVMKQLSGSNDPNHAIIWPDTPAPSVSDDLTAEIMRTPTPQWISMALTLGRSADPGMN
jgi:hypothetical protein